jgi:hypothetical protein
MTSASESRCAWLFLRWPGPDHPSGLKFPFWMSFKVGMLEPTEPNAWNIPTGGLD